MLAGQPPTTSPPTPPTPPAPAHPDWSIITTDVLCPLCDYNLRGLADNRCPECGYVFDWNEVLHPEILRHPYLFEHNTKRPVRSFFRTAAAGLMPHRFWRTLRATHLPFPRRLFVYWLLCALVLLAMPGFMFLRRAYDLNNQLTAARQQEMRWLTRNDRWGAAQRDRITRGWGSVQAYLDNQYPPVTSTVFLKRAWNETITPSGWFYRGTANVFVALPASVVVLLWPWLTFLTLMIFLASMRRASVRPAHVMRCAVYVSDAIWLVPILVVLAPGELMFLGHYNYAVDASSLTLINVTVCFAAVATYRLAAAYRLYLKFPHATAVALASQLILALTVIAYALNADRFWRF